MARKPPSRTISDYMAAIGRRGGQKKVPKGTAKLSQRRRQEIARKAAAARWAKSKKD